MAPLQSGYYSPKNVRRVTVWPAPDINGDGPELFQDKHDPVGGQFLGRDIILDPGTGQAIRHYYPPAGFAEIPTRDPGADRATGAHVRTDHRGMPVRNPKTGEAIGIREGSALVEYPDGTFDLLLSDFAKVLFQRSHDLLTDPNTALPIPEPGNVVPGRVVAPGAPVSPESAPASPANVPPDYADYLAWKAAQASPAAKVFDEPLPPPQVAPAQPVYPSADQVPQPDAGQVQSVNPLPWDSPTWGGSGNS